MEETMLLNPGSLVYDGACSLHLGEVIKNGTGGEGAVFSLQERPEMVAKIFRGKASDKLRFEKLSRMLSEKYEKLKLAKNISWPQSILKDEHGNPVGYCMRKINGVSLKSGFMVRSAREQQFREWNEAWGMEQLLHACNSMLGAFSLLHRNHVLMADVNDGNVMFDQQGNAFLVDTDSYQFEEYPCLVASEEYLSPEYKARSEKTNSALRNEQDEYYAIAVLLFRIFMAGIYPYENQEKEEGLFPYHLTFGGKEAEEWYQRTRQYRIGNKTLRDVYQPSCKWVWNALPYQIKRMFFKTFVPEAREPEDVVYCSPSLWIRQIRQYIRQIEDGHAGNELWPETSKTVKNENGELVSARKAVCECCGAVFDAKWVQDEQTGIWQEQTRCALCEKMQTEDIDFYCTSCGQGVTMLKKDYDFLVFGNRLESPDYTDYYLCPDCLREVRRKREEEKHYQQIRENMERYGKISQVLSLRFAELKRAGYFTPRKAPEPPDPYERILAKYRTGEMLIPSEVEAASNCVMDYLCRITENFETFRRQLGEKMELAEQNGAAFWKYPLPMGYPARFVEFLYWEERKHGKIQKWLQICLTDQPSDVYTSEQEHV